MDCVITTELYDTIKELTIKGDLKSFEFYFQNKGVDVFINEIYNKRLNEIFIENDELYSQLECFNYDNEFMSNGIFYPYIEEGTLKLKVTFKEDYFDGNYVSGDLEDVVNFYETIKDKLEKWLGPEFNLDNLELQMSMTSDREFGHKLDSYKLIYSVPEREEVINLSVDENLKMAAIDYFGSWATKSCLGAAGLIGKELDFAFSIEIEESYISNYIEYIHDIINLKRIN